MRKYFALSLMLFSSFCFGENPQPYVKLPCDSPLPPDTKILPSIPAPPDEYQCLKLPKNLMARFIPKGENSYFISLDELKNNPDKTYKISCLISSVKRPYISKDGYITISPNYIMPGAYYNDNPNPIWQIPLVDDQGNPPKLRPNEYGLPILISNVKLNLNIEHTGFYLSSAYESGTFALNYCYVY